MEPWLRVTMELDTLGHIAFKGDAVPLIQSLPREGELAVHVSPRVGIAQDGIFPLAGLDAVRAKIAAACKWPHVIAKPNN